MKNKIVLAATLTLVLASGSAMATGTGGKQFPPQSAKSAVVGDISWWQQFTAWF